MGDINLDKIRRALEADGYSWNNAIQSFIEAYYGLQLFDADGQQLFDFDAVDAAAGIYPDRVAYYSQLANQQLIPIGTCGNGHAVIMMDTSGRVYGGYDDQFWSVAESGDACILRLSNRLRKTPHV